MRFQPRKPLRLSGFDYTQCGAYFVTICTRDRAYLFGDVINGQMILNEMGRLVMAAWDDLACHYPFMTLDAFVVMPNHVHGIVWIEVEATLTVSLPVIGEALKPSAPNRSLTEIIRAFKSFSARRINEMRQTPGCPVWQRGYHDHIIRNDSDLTRIREYIAHNPAQWALDDENPQKHS